MENRLDELIAHVEQSKMNDFYINIKNCFNWFKNHMGDTEWNTRKKSLINYFKTMEEGFFKFNNSKDSSENRMIYHYDLITWYMYLADIYLDSLVENEPNQSARILPILAEIGRMINELKNCNGIDIKLNDLLIKKSNQPDTLLFELLVACCYIRNGWNVKFIPETPKEKTPDLLIRKNDSHYFVECKRLNKVTDYSEKERNEWLKHWKYISPTMLNFNESLILDIVFLNEVEKVKTTDICNSLSNLINNFSKDRNIKYLSHTDFILKINIIDISKIKLHLDDNNVKIPSPLIFSLIDPDYSTDANYTFIGDITLCKLYEKDDHDKENRVLNTFLDSVRKIACAKWECISNISLDKKARDIKNLLSKATEQAPEDATTIIHLGYETLHGPTIEKIREQKIKATISKFDFGTKEIGIIYLHALQAICPPNEKFDFVETTQWLAKDQYKDIILADDLLINFSDSNKQNKTHW
ncbi:hypothetical protein R4U62_002646 [Proteus mirabilis]|uniref:hypothetical protein n=2 Tax=Proteus mirabilis TaxID=584 RepID=UPI00073B2B30|nr:hypothetical protein [Proteus mirabilis]NAC33109.1 hypothetical protein [Escherichia coli]ARX08040.1 hypothetical protein AM405_03845 [Proteus mirabilis]ELA8072341.1 hypothetical protein [Proteus mirabilis]ELJ9403475.1 hypothetical protein [Proteus mirabilis]ELJ9437548.1 hypothetical protein [Proteus mirabilis]